VVSRLEGGNRGPNGVDDAGCFVAHDDRLLGGYEAFASAMEPEMDLVLVVRLGSVMVRGGRYVTYVASADACVCDANDHVRRVLDLRDGSVFESCVKRAVQET
jgi:hypothetical protein